MIQVLAAPLKHRHFWKKVVGWYEDSMRGLILEDNIDKLHELAKYLYEHETITGEEFMKILNDHRSLFAASAGKKHFCII